MKRYRILLRALALGTIPILGFVGCILGFLITGVITTGWFTEWHSLGSPPEMTRRIIGADFGHVYLESENGSLFGFEPSLWSDQAPIGTWTVTNNTQVDELTKCNYVAPMGPTAPVNTIDLVQFGYCPEPRIDVRYALLSDGSVLRWASPNGMEIMIVAVPVGIVVGIVVGLLLTIIVWLYTKSTPSEVREVTTP
jgi:hypothetical protein